MGNSLHKVEVTQISRPQQGILILMNENSDCFFYFRLSQPNTGFNRYSEEKDLIWHDLSDDGYFAISSFFRHLL